MTGQINIKVIKITVTDFFDLFPKDENRETEVSGFRFFVFVISTNAREGGEGG